MSAAEALESRFPKLLPENYRITSVRDTAYNCVAWIAGDFNRWWAPAEGAPGFYWPSSAPQEDALGSYLHVFRLLRFEECLSGEPEPGFEKIAIYVDESGYFSHVARQLPNGDWSSKLGELNDIQHRLGCLAGEGLYEYGSVQCFMRRERISDDEDSLGETGLIRA